VSHQLALFQEQPRTPEGFRYRTDLINESQERALVAELLRLPFRAFEFHGFVGKRRVVSFGWRYDFNHARLDAGAPMPEFLLALRDAAAQFAGLPPASFEHALVTEYAPGATIGWHRDRPTFDSVIGISLLAPCLFRFRKKQGAAWQRASFTLAPRSAYLLQGPSRSKWEHSIPAVTQLRYSVTFRNLA
jgi:alkylated DNA repair dioxygenase AlkB